MERGEAPRAVVLRLEELAELPARHALSADLACAFRVERRFVIYIFCTENIEPPVARPHAPMPPLPRRNDAVECVYSPLYPFKHVLNAPDAEEVAGLFFRQKRHYPIQDTRHHLARVAEGIAEGAADADAVEAHRAYGFCAFLPQALEFPSLHAAIKQL